MPDRAFPRSLTGPRFVVRGILIGQLPPTANIIGRQAWVGGGDETPGVDQTTDTLFFTFFSRPFSLL